MKVKIVADEWANSLEHIRTFTAAGSAGMIHLKTPQLGGVQNLVDAVLAYKANSIGAFMGGSRVESGLSARVSIHIASAVRADIVMAMPGKGIDEAILFTQNEMARSLASIAHRV